MMRYVMFIKKCLRKIRNLLKKSIYAYFIFPIIQRKKIDIFDYKSIIQKRPDRDFSFAGENNFYGASYIIKRYAGINKNTKLECIAEHGLSIGGYFHGGGDWTINGPKTLLTYADFRVEEIYKRTGKICFNIGPIIKYAKCVYDDFTISSIKGNLGKTLLIFPMHSIEDYQYNNNTERFIDSVKKIKNQFHFQTVLVSVYFVDIERGLHIPYLEQGWQIVSSGERCNYDYMDIQKTLMTIADGVYVQGYSSALPYAISLGKPGAIFYHEDDVIVDHPGSERKFEQLYDDEYKDAFFEFLHLFSEYSDIITDEQIEYCNKYCGFNNTKTPEELKTIIEFCNELQRRNDINKVAIKPKYKSLYSFIKPYLSKKI